MNNDSRDCPFCQPDGILLENELAYAKPDKFPVNPGHLLIIPKRHVANYFHSTDEEKFAFLSLLDEAKRYLDEKHAPAGYNIGINVGEVAARQSSTYTCISFRAITVTSRTRAEVCAA